MGLSVGCGSWVPSRGSWVSSRGSWVVGPKSWVPSRGSWVVGRGLLIGRDLREDGFSGSLRFQLCQFPGNLFYSSYNRPKL